MACAHSTSPITRRRCAWFVPQLLVDPDGWQARLETAGPQVITGMRGCGKTMLLRSLQFHARASLAAQHLTETGEDAAEQLARDGYVGLYVSCTRLLDRLGSPTAELHEPYARLFLVYAREALRALRHLRRDPPRHAVGDAGCAPDDRKCGRVARARRGPGRGRVGTDA